MTIDQLQSTALPTELSKVLDSCNLHNSINTKCQLKLGGPKHLTYGRYYRVYSKLAHFNEIYLVIISFNQCTIINGANSDGLNFQVRTTWSNCRARASRLPKMRRPVTSKKLRPRSPSLMFQSPTI